jgi:hypothetical protein
LPNLTIGTETRPDYKGSLRFRQPRRSRTNSNPDERAILEAAAEQARTSLSDFMRRKALEAAEVEVLGALDRHHSRQGLGTVRGLARRPW